MLPSLVIVALATLASPPPFRLWNGALDTMRAAWLVRLDGGTADLGELAGFPDSERHLWRGSAVVLATVRSDYDPVLVQRFLDQADRYVQTLSDLCGNSPPPPEGGLPRGTRGLLLVEHAGLGLAVEQPGVGVVSLERAELEDCLRLALRHPAPLPLGETLPRSIARTYFFFQGELGAAALDGSSAPAEAFGFLLEGRACDRLGWVLPPDPRPLEAIADAFGDTKRDPDTIPPANDVDSWTALLLRLQTTSGRPDFVDRLWPAIAECPFAATTEEAMRNLIVSTTAAANADQTPRFEAWGFAIDPETKARAAESVAAA